MTEDGMRARRSGRAGLVVTVTLLAMLFLFGGGSSPDIWSLPILRPAAILLTGWGMLRLHARDVRAGRLVFGMVAAAMTLCLLYLMPLPPAFWQALPARALAVTVDRTAGLDPGWRPASLVPKRTENAFFSLWIPLAMLVWAIPLDRAARRMLMTAAMLLIAASGLFAMVQIAAGAPAALYPYANTTVGGADGLFANRNHL